MSRERTSNEPEWDEAEERERSRVRKHERHAKLEQEIKAVASDELGMAREIVNLKKELNRLHYKVKHYQQQSRVVNAIVNTIFIILLVAILYKLYN